MDIFSIPEAVPMGPISLSQLLSNANQRVSELKIRLQEEQDRLGRMTTLFENERNARLTAQSILDITCNELKQSKNSLKLANDKIRLLERRILIETGTFSRALLKTRLSEISRCFVEPSACHPSDRVGLQKPSETIYPFPGGETSQRAMLPDAPRRQTDREVTTSDKPPERHPEEIIREAPTKESPMKENSLASVRLSKKGLGGESTLGLRHKIQRTLQCQWEFAKLLRDKGDAMVGEFKAGLRLLNNLHARLEKLREPGEKEITEKSVQEHQWQSELGSTKRTLFNLGTKIQKMIIELASLTLDQKLYEGRIEADMRGFEDRAIFTDGSDNTEEKLMVFSQPGYRCKLARLIWDRAAHFRNEKKSADTKAQLYTDTAEYVFPPYGHLNFESAIIA